MGKTPHTRPFWPFWAYSRTLPQGVELLVQPLVKSLFCPINASPNEFFVRTPGDPPHLKPTFLRYSGRGVGVGVGGFLGRKSQIFWFFSILSRKSVSRSRLHGVCMGRSGTSAYGVYALLSHFWYVGGFGDLGDLVVRTLRGVSGDIVTVYAY